jgi:tRNA pseudouridine38-40 synthase
VGAGRTDAGVHARGQAIHFDLNEDDMQSEEDVRKLEHSINRMLGRDVCVYNLQEAPITTKEIQGKNMNLQWNAIHDATGKLYIYRISATKSMDPIERHTRWDLKWRDTDMDLLERTLKRYQGTHDFRSFAGNVELLERSLGGRLDTRRTVNSVNVVDESEGLYRIEVHLNGALYKMVRNLIGTAMEVAWGRLSEADFEALLNNASGRKENKSKPAPPEGLTLEHVYYDGY